MTKELKIFLGIWIFTALLGVVSAGCCFDPENGLCSTNTERQRCEANGGQYSGDDSCLGVSECSLGCCVLGGETAYSTARECELLARSSGFEIDFRDISAGECSELGSSQEEGACVYEGDFDNECRVITKGECIGSGGEFFPGKTCVDPGIDSICELVDKTVCHEDDVYQLDSCGNIAKVVDDCDYESGSICGRYRPGKDDRPSLGNYVCRNLNCGSHGNGDRWCVTEEANLVGSRHFSQYCLNGEIFTDPCDDFRFGYCEGGECRLNPWQECLAVNEIDEEAPEGGVGGFELEDCNEEFCKIWGIEAGEEREVTVKNPVIKRGRGGITGGGTSTITISENEILADLELDMCVPIMPGGLVHYPSSEGFEPDESAEEICAAGNFAIDIEFQGCNPFKCVGGCGLVEGSQEWGISNSCEGGGGRPEGNIWDIDDATQETVIAAWDTNGLEGGELPINQEVVALLNDRCRAIGDCNGKYNIVDSFGGEEKVIEVAGFKERHDNDPDTGRDSVYYSFEFTCEPWSAPEGGECEVCGGGEDELPCSEYRCRSIGKHCQYFEPEGTDRGYCAASQDTNPPSISCVDCPDIVPPFSGTEIIIATNEEAECRFDVGSPGRSYEDMPYDFIEGFGTEHRTILSVPGQKPEIGEEEVERHDIINRDGKYDIYIRCIDVRGNFNIAPFKTSFEVMETPDRIPPVLRDFSPENGASVRHNVTEKLIRFKSNEPAECKWSLEDKEYENMAEEFRCDEDISDDGFINGYDCSGTLTDLKTEPGAETDYFIRCKDQPWLEGNEDDTYRRNVNRESFVYRLKASSGLEIVEISPEGEVTGSEDDTGTKIEVVTSGGAEDGKAECKFVLDGSPLLEFIETGSSRHVQPLSNQTEGVHEVRVVCEDIAGNKAERSWSFKTEIDRLVPRITRVFRQSGNLVLVTNEPSMCFVDIRGCNFDINDAIEMSSLEGIRHSADFDDEVVNFVKCKDNFGNQHGLCALKVREGFA